MKKLIAVVLLASSMIITAAPAQANLKTRTSTPTLAILDTALDTSIPYIKSRLIAEVCILDWPSCPNKKAFMEGSGSTVLPMNILSNSNFSHGTQMASVALLNNPNLNIVFVRIFGHTPKGQRQTTGINTLVNALNWVQLNRIKYNIVAVSASQGASNPVINKIASSRYCSVTALDSVVSNLNNVGVPVFFPAGNSAGIAKMNGKIEWPACIQQSIAVGGVETLGVSKPTISLISNYDKNLVDIWGDINQPALYPGNINGYSYGTSAANQVVAAKYVALKAFKPNLTVDQLMAIIKSSADKVENDLSQEVYLFNLSRAINGQ